MQDPCAAIEVSTEPIPDSLLGGTVLVDIEEMRLSATADAVLIEDANARILVEGTTRVTVNLRTGVSWASIESYFYGVIARCLLLHAGTFTLHGSAVRIDGRTIAIGGFSGAGKSTTVSALAVAGGELVIDDVTPLVVLDDHVVVDPFPRPVRLLPEAAERLGIEHGGLEGSATKVAVDLAAPAEPTRLDLIVSLATDPDLDHPLVATVVQGAARFQRVVRLANDIGLSSVGRSGAFASWATRVAQEVRVLEIVRRPGEDTLDEVLDIIRSH